MTFIEELAGFAVPYLFGSHGVVSSLQAGVVLTMLGVGVLKGLSLTTKSLTYFYRHFFRPAKNLSAYGSWAIVSGATDGIGREYCNCLAKQGMNVYLVSRTESKLQAAAAEISKTYGVETKIYATDLAAAGCQPLDSTVWSQFRASIAGMDIGVLINNAGMSYEHPEYFHLLDPSVIDNLGPLNNAALVKMTYTVLPVMLQRRKGAIVNVSSGAGTFIPLTPLLSLYAASKSFVAKFSTVLAAEYRSMGIDVQVQSPGVVQSKMSKVRKATMSIPPPDVFAAASCQHIGYEDHSIPYFFHAIEAAAFAAMPRPMVDSFITSMMHGIRRAALKKKAAANKAQ